MSSGTTALLTSVVGIGGPVSVSTKLHNNIGGTNGSLGMPLSRTRSLLSNINGVSIGSGGSSSTGSSSNSNGGVSQSTNGDSPGDNSSYGLSLALDSSQTGPSSLAVTTHLPPLKGSSKMSNSGYVGGIDVGVGLIQRLLSNGNGSVEGDSNYSQMSMSTTQITQNGHHGHGQVNGNGRPVSADYNSGSSVLDGSSSSKGSRSGVSGASAAVHANGTSGNPSGGGGAKFKSNPATPEQVTKLYQNRLTPYELSEIHGYSQIFFVGLGAKKRPGIIGSQNNNGYDDDQGKNEIEINFIESVGGVDEGEDQYGFWKLTLLFCRVLHPRSA